MTDVQRVLTRALRDRYAIDGEIGHGGMATVYRARDLRHDRVVAIKVLHPQLTAAVGHDRFLREIAIGARLQHPHILTLIDSGEVSEGDPGSGGPSFLYYVMPFVEGESLRDRLVRAGGPLPVSEVTRLLRDVVDALAYAHRHGVIHRDIKPDNVMIAGRHALVVDFGVAKAVASGPPPADAGGGTASGVDTPTLTVLGTSLGTPAYMAPEQAAGDAVDHRADIYAAGIMAYEMLNGRPPFTGSGQSILAAQITAAPQPIGELRADVPPALAEIVMRCLAKDPADRYQTADDLLIDIEGLSMPTDMAGGLPAVDRGAMRKRVVAVVAAVVIVAAAGWIFLSGRARRRQWVHETAIPEIQRLAENYAFDSAYALAVRAGEAAPDDRALEALWPKFSSAVVLKSVPPGARVYRQLLGDSSRWDLIGTTPTDSVRLPILVYTRLRLEQPGYRSMEVSLSPTFMQDEPFVLDSVDSADSAMVHVSAGEFPASMPGLDHLPPLALTDFLMDRYEVTNRDYKRFVDAGGYTKPEYWDRPFIRDGRTLSFAEGVAGFTDKTGRPGPSTWEAGNYPSGADDVAVGGISWFEAAAYAKFVGKSLPTLYHWNRAAEAWASAWVVPGSNYDGQGPRRGSTTRGMGPFGTFDMAGNVREWCENASESGRYILGGGWNDQTYSFNDAYSQNAFDRSATNGIRLVKYLRNEPNLQLAKAPLVRSFRDYTKERPVSDAVFDSYRRMYDYDRAPLNATVEARDSTADDWIRERVSFTAAYGNERMFAYLFLPKRGTPPFQTVVYFPGSNAIHTRSSADLNPRSFDFFLRNGRAVMMPIYKSTYERGDSLNSDYSDESVFYRDHVVMWGKDFRRSVDYLVTRPDIDSARLAYFGISWGGELGGIMPAIEPRLKAVVLNVAGLGMERARPEADVLNFLPRIHQPVIMLNAKYDHFFPIETAQKPFFDYLGTPPDQKRYVVYEGGHILPRADLIRASLDWLDKYLGPVK